MANNCRLKNIRRERSSYTHTDRIGVYNKRCRPGGRLGSGSPPASKVQIFVMDPMSGVLRPTFGGLAHESLNASSMRGNRARTESGTVIDSRRDHWLE